MRYAPVHCCAGLLAAAGVLGHDATPPVMHLRTMNPYVTAALGDWPKSARLQSRIALQPAPANGEASCAGAPAIVGTSSFGMSGVNAHALLCRPTTLENTLVHIPVSWLTT